MSDVLDRLPSYGRYKPTGFAPTGDIPEHWEVLRNKYIFSLKKSQVGRNSHEYDLLSLTLRGVILRDMENPEGKFPAEFDTYQPVEEDDFVFCLFDVEETPRTIGVSQHKGMITGAYTVLECDSTINHHYLEYLYLYLDSHKMLRSLYKGLRNTIPKDVFFSFSSILPPREEQDAIVSYLRKKVTQIDNAIETKRAQISLLNEHRQALAQKAVLYGLDPDVLKQESAVPWIGEIPSHWDVKPLCAVAEPKSISNCPERDLLSVYLDRGVIKFSDVEEKRTNATSLDLTNYQAVDPGDFVLNNQQAWRGSVGVSQIAGIVSPAYIVLTLSDRLDPRFANYMLRSSAFVAQYLRASKGVGTIQRNLYWPHLKRMPIFIPPMAEQIQIADFIESETIKLDAALSSQTMQIDKLMEYKSSLIFSAVTGKIKIS